jgi:hypothetical protein
MDQDTAVSSALVKLLKAAQTGIATQSDFDARANLARKAEELASQWQSWVAKSVVFLARSFFLFDPTGASEVFGGMAKVLEMMQAGGVEACSSEDMAPHSVGRPTPPSTPFEPRTRSGRTIPSFSSVC